MAGVELQPHENLIASSKMIYWIVKKQPDPFSLTNNDAFLENSSGVLMLFQKNR